MSGQLGLGKPCHQDSVTPLQDVRGGAEFHRVAADIRDHLLHPGRRLHAGRGFLETRGLHDEIFALGEKPHDFAIEPIDVGADFAEAFALLYGRYAAHARFNPALRPWLG